MSKQAGNAVATKPRLQKLDAKQFAADQQAKPMHKTEAQLREESLQKLEAARAKKSTEVAANKLNNDAFAVYASVDVDALQSQAIEAGKTGEAASRKETQLQIANILARYAQDKFLGDASPLKLYTVQPDNSHSFNVGTAKLITRMIYDVPEKTLDGKKNALPQHLLARVRRIAPLVFFAITERIPLVWSEDFKALLVPTWMLVSDAALVPGIWNPETAAAMRMTFPKPQPVDGKDGRTLDAIIKRVEAVQKPKGRGTNSGDITSPAEQQEQKLRSSMSNHGLAKTLELVADMFTKAPADKPFTDDVVELLAVCCEHIASRNGPDALGKVISEFREPTKRQSAA